MTIGLAKEDDTVILTDFVLLTNVFSLLLYLDVPTAKVWHFSSWQLKKSNCLWSAVSIYHINHFGVISIPVISLHYFLQIIIA